MPTRSTTLIVDDQPENLAVLGGLLEPHYRVIAATSGQRALQLAVTEPQPDLILLDIMMPEMQGREVLARLRQDPRTRDIPVIFVTTLGSNYDEEQGLLLGAADYITKPIRPTIMLARVLNQLEIKQARDLVNRRNAELSAALDDLRRTQEELIRAARQASLGIVVAGIAHELNTPIGNSLTVATTLSDKTREFAEAAKGTLHRSDLTEFIRMSEQAAELLTRNMHRAHTLVSNFKQVAVDQASEQRRSFDLATMVGEVAAMLRPTLNKTPWQLIVDIPSGITMDSFPGPLGQVIGNLVDNAITHAFDGRDQGMIRIDALVSDNEVVLKVSDDGLGMTAAVREHAFDPFFTTMLGKGGSGLGLHIVFNIVTEILGGGINLVAAPGNGSRFTLRLPLIAPTRVTKELH